VKIKHMNFLGGLPRSGSTLLATLLNQHPKIYASPHSALLDGLCTLRETFVNSETVRYGLQLSACQKTLWTLPQHFYEDVEKDIIVDKQFAWSTKENYELATKISTYPRFILTYRPVLEVLASFIDKAAKNPDFYLNAELESNYFYAKEYLNKNDAMAEYLMTQHHLIPKAILALSYAKQNENQGNFKFVAYDDLVNNPQKVMNDIFDFMKVEPMEIQVEGVENVFIYKDLVPLGVEDFHWVRPEIKKESPKPEDLFSDFILGKYDNALAPIGL
jgi:sulfotransferase